MNVKLTLRMDDSLIRAAKKKAHQSGKSLSRMVADYFYSMRGRSSAKPQQPDTLMPITSSLIGSWKGKHLGLKDYHRYLEEKYQ